MHPVLAEICRAKEVPTRTDVLRRWQAALRDEVQPLLDRLEQIEAGTPESTSAKAGARAAKREVPA